MALAACDELVFFDWPPGIFGKVRFGLTKHFRRETVPPRGSARTWSMSPVLQSGVSAGTIIDVGVADGTPTLYAAFPKSRLLLIEPMVEFREAIGHVLRERSGEWVQSAVGSTSGTAQIKVFPGRPLQTSMFSRSDVGGVLPRERTVRVETIDDIVSARSLPDPLFLKMDAEGSEYEILLGASRTLARMSGIISEVNLDDRYGGAAPGLRDIDHLLKVKGFGLAAILDAAVVYGREAIVYKVDLFYLREG